MKTIDRKAADNIKLITRISLSAIVLVTVLLFSVANANAGENTIRAEKNLSKQINKMLEYPNSILEGKLSNPEDITLFFALDEQGVMDIHKAVGGNNELSEYVAKALDGKTVSEFPAVANKYKIVISFKTL